MVAGYAHRSAQGSSHRRGAAARIYSSSVKAGFAESIGRLLFDGDQSIARDNARVAGQSDGDGVPESEASGRPAGLNLGPAPGRHFVRRVDNDRVHQATPPNPVTKSGGFSSSAPECPAG